MWLIWKKILKRVKPYYSAVLKRQVVREYESDFLRVHKSFIVAKKWVQSLDGNQLVIEKLKIPISRERKDEIVKEIFGL